MRRGPRSSRTRCSAGRACCASARSIIVVCGASLRVQFSRSDAEVKRKAIFLDRDGTLNVDVGYLHRLEDLELFPWTADALRLLKRAGYALVVVTNQSGIAHGTDRAGVRAGVPRRDAAAAAAGRRRPRRAVLLQSPSARLDRVAGGRLPVPEAVARDGRRCRAGPGPRSRAVVGDRRQVARRQSRARRRRAIDPRCAPVGAPSRSSAVRRGSAWTRSATTSLTPCQ